MQTSVVFVLCREWSDEFTMVRVYRRREQADDALRVLTEYVTNPDAPGPVNVALWFGIRSVVGAGLLYLPKGGEHWQTEAESRAAYPDEWALIDAKRAAHHWWRRANPVDPGWEPGDSYTIEVVDEAPS